MAIWPARNCDIALNRSRGDTLYIRETISVIHHQSNIPSQVQTSTNRFHHSTIENLTIPSIIHNQCNNYYHHINWFGDWTASEKVKNTVKYWNILIVQIVFLRYNQFVIIIITSHRLYIIVPTRAPSYLQSIKSIIDPVEYLEIYTVIYAFSLLDAFQNSVWICFITTSYETCRC